MRRADGTPATLIRDKLVLLEQRRVELDAELAAPADDVLRLHPSLPAVYRARVAELHAALDADDACEAREALRRVIETIVLHPEPSGLRVEVRGELSAVLALGSGSTDQGNGDAERCARQIKMVAGTGYDLWRTVVTWPFPNRSRSPEIMCDDRLAMTYDAARCLVATVI